MANEPIRIDQPYSCSGIFWDPRTSERFSGTLSYAPDEGLRLEAAAQAITIDKLFSFQEDEIPFIVGMLSDGTMCNLIGVQMTSNPQAWSDAGVAVSTPVFHVSLALLGNGVGLTSPSNFDELHLSYEVLQAICELPQIPFENDAGNVTLHLPAAREPLMTATTQGGIAQFRIGRKLSIGFVGRARATYEAVLTFLPDTPRDFDGFRDWIALATGLVTLLAGQHSAPYWIKLTRKSDATTPNAKYVHVLFHYMHDFPKYRHPGEAAVRLRDLGDTGPTLLKNWFDGSETERRVYNLYLGTLYTQAYVESHFLALAQAIESFHRVFHNSELMSKETFATVKQALRQACSTVTLPGDVAERLVSAFDFLNELTLQNRLDQVIETLTPEARESLIGDPIMFTRTLKQTRNYLTHPGIEKKGAVLSTPLQFLGFNRRLMGLLRLLILRRLGAKESDVLRPSKVGLLPG